MMTILSHEFHDDTLTHEFHDGNPSYLMISMMKLLSVNSWDPMITLSPHEFHAGTLNLWVQWWHSYSWVPWWQSYLTISMMTLLSFNSWDPIITLSPVFWIQGFFPGSRSAFFSESGSGSAKNPDPDRPKIRIWSGKIRIRIWIREINVLKLELK